MAKSSTSNKVCNWWSTCRGSSPAFCLVRLPISSFSREERLWKGLDTWPVVSTVSPLTLTYPLSGKRRSKHLCDQNVGCDESYPENKTSREPVILNWIAEPCGFRIGHYKSLIIFRVKNSFWVFNVNIYFNFIDNKLVAYKTYFLLRANAYGQFGSQFACLGGTGYNSLLKSMTG